MQEVRFEFPSTEGLPLRGKMTLPEGKPAHPVLMIHGFKGFMDWGFMPLLAERLTEAGLAVCRFNLSGSGIGADDATFSERANFENATFSQDLEDVKKVVTMLARGKIPGARTLSGKLGIFGHSRGAGTAIMAAEQELLVSTMALWAPISKIDRFSGDELQAWRRDGFLRVENARTGDVFKLSIDVLEDMEAHLEDMNILAAAHNMDIPTLIVHGSKDETVPFMEGKMLDSALGENSEIICVHEGSHTFGATHPMPGEPLPDLDSAISATARHFQRHLT